MIASKYVTSYLLKGPRGVEYALECTLIFSSDIENMGIRGKKKISTHFQKCAKTLNYDVIGGVATLISSITRITVLWN